MYLDLHGVLIEIHLEHMSEYLDIVQSALEQKQKELDLFINEKEKNLNDEDKDELHNRYGDDYWKLYEVLPEHFYNSFIIGWYSFMETKLFDLCKFLEIDKHLILDYRDIAGKGITKARKYLVKVAGVKPTELYWDELDKIGKIRNRLVHSEGQFPDDEWSKLRPYLLKQEVISGTLQEEFTASLNYCRYLISFGKEFFTNLYYDAGVTTSRTNFLKKRGGKVV